jgi:dUTP pyrophosphatase
MYIRIKRKNNMIKYSKTRKVKSPSRGTDLSAGIDFFVPDEWNGGSPLSIPPGGRVLIPSGIKVSVPNGHALIAFNKSGVASKTGLVVGACVVDEDYQGEVHINMINTNQPIETTIDGAYASNSGHVMIEPGQKLVQFILVPVNYATPTEVELEGLYAEETQRGEGGFGSTGTI